MQKLILIIIATIVNQFMSGHDQSKLVYNNSLESVYQYCNADCFNMKIRNMDRWWCPEDVCCN